jgi:hypothetical protein
MNKKQFFYLLNNVLKITLDDNPNSIFYVWNKSIERQLKYNRLFNSKKQIKYKYNQKDILFEQDLKNKKIWYDYDKIYRKINRKNEYKDLNISELIDGWLMDDTNWKLYTSDRHSFLFTSVLKDDTNWKLYTSNTYWLSAFR